MVAVADYGEEKDSMMMTRMMMVIMRKRRRTMAMTMTMMMMLVMMIVTMMMVMMMTIMIMMTAEPSSFTAPANVPGDSQIVCRGRLSLKATSLYSHLCHMPSAFQLDVVQMRSEHIFGL